MSSNPSGLLGAPGATAWLLVPEWVASISDTADAEKCIQHNIRDSMTVSGPSETEPDNVATNQMCLAGDVIADIEPCSYFV